MTRAIATKAEFYRLWHGGVLGNRPRTWPDEAALAASGYAGPVSIRYRVPDGGRWKRYYVPAAEVPGVVAAMAGAGADRGLFAFNESMPDDRLTLQGEVARLPGGLVLRYSTARGLPMCEAMAGAREVRGVAARAILDACLGGDDRDDLDGLLDLYPDCVVEFSAYEVPVGVLPGRRCVIWEVRSY